MKLIFALGNPGSEYAGTRHNTGFMVIDKFAHDHGVSFSEKTKFRAYVAETSFEGDKVLLVKPTTFYNNVGESARSLIDFYKLSPIEDLLVIHDDLALPFGTIRVRTKGSDAGNNGIKSITSHLGSEYSRLRIGIKTSFKDRIENSDFVLSKFTDEEKHTIQETVIPKALELGSMFLSARLQDTSHKLLEN